VKHSIQLPGLAGWWNGRESRVSYTLLCAASVGVRSEKLPVTG